MIHQRPIHPSLSYLADAALPFHPCQAQSPYYTLDVSSASFLPRGCPPFHDAASSQCTPNTTSRQQPKKCRGYPEGPRWRVSSVEVCPASDPDLDSDSTTSFHHRPSSIGQAGSSSAMAVGRVAATAIVAVIRASTYQCTSPHFFSLGKFRLPRQTPLLLTTSPDPLTSKNSPMHFFFSKALLQASLCFRRARPG